MNRDLNVQDLLEWREDKLVMYASDSRGQKELYSNLRCGFEIHVAGKKVFECISAYSAIKKYNEL